MPKHDTISQELRAEIACGRYEASGRLPSEAQLVERFGVSRPTIARALRDLQAEGLIQRRAGSGTYVQPPGRIPSAAKVLGLLVPERGTTEIFEAICGELGALARVHGFGLLWGGSPMPYADRDSTPEHAAEVCRQFIKTRPGPCSTHSAHSHCYSCSRLAAAFRFPLAVFVSL